MSKKYVLIADRDGGDWSIDLFFAGLVKNVGIENVIVFPDRVKFKQGIPPLVGDDEKDYGTERRSACYVEEYEKLIYYKKQEIIKLLLQRQVEYIFVDETDSAYAKWIELVGPIQNITVKTVVIAGHDSFRGEPEEVRRRYGKHFHYMFIDDWVDRFDKLSFKEKGIINFSCNFDHLWDSGLREVFNKNKIYDICFYGYNSRPVRKLVIDYVKDKYKHLNNAIVFEERPDTYNNFIRHKELYEIMSRSKICLNLPGASTGGKALRYYEIPYLGSCMVTQKTNAKLLYPFEHKINCLEFSTLPELDECIEYAYSIDNNGEYMYNILAKKGYEHCMKYHTASARVKYVLEILNG